MIKVDIVNEVSRMADITKVKAEVAVDAVFDAMRASMMRGERIELRGFGVFQVKPRKRGIGRNPAPARKCGFPPAGRSASSQARNCRTSAVTAGEPTDATTPVPPHDLPPKATGAAFRRTTARRNRHRLRAAASCFLSRRPRPRAALYGAFMSEPSTRPTRYAAASCLMNSGLWYIVPVLTILGAHEIGHYVAVPQVQRRRHAALLSCPCRCLTGTLGAFIRIREPIPSKQSAVRYRHRRPDCRIPDAAAVAVLRHGMSQRGPEADSARRHRARRAAAVQVDVRWCVRTIGAGDDGQPASDGICRLVRHAGDGAQPDAVRTARRRPHHLRRRSAVGRRLVIDRDRWRSRSGWRSSRPAG